MGLLTSIAVVFLAGAQPAFPFPFGIPLPMPREDLPANVVPDLALGASLLAAEHGTPVGELSRDMKALVGASVKKVAVELQILDERECGYNLSPEERDDMFQSDLDGLRAKKKEMADAPRLEDSFRMPPREYSVSQCQFNRSFLKNLEQQRLLNQDKLAIYEMVISETEWCYRMWDKIRDSRCEFYYVVPRRRALQQLRDEMGAKAYEQGAWPPCVPVWRFNELR